MAAPARFLLVSTLILAINVAFILAMAKGPELQTMVDPGHEVLPPSKPTRNLGKQPQSKTPGTTTEAPAVVIISPTASQLQKPQIMKPSNTASQLSADHEQQPKALLSSMEAVGLGKPILMVHDHGGIDHPDAEPTTSTKVGAEMVSAGERHGMQKVARADHHMVIGSEEHGTEYSYKENHEGGDDQKKHHAAAGILMNAKNAEAPAASRRFGKHHGSSDKSIAGGGVILGGLATTFLVSIFCYIRATRRSSKSIINGEADTRPVHPIIV